MINPPPSRHTEETPLLPNETNKVDRINPEPSSRCVRFIGYDSALISWSQGEPSNSVPDGSSGFGGLGLFPIPSVSHWCEEDLEDTPCEDGEGMAIGMSSSDDAIASKMGTGTGTGTGSSTIW